ncbi:MAG TPA: hypothetical protein PKH24_18080 [Sedimentisphaerales bacterium]|jgi:hypothetical protein|nr:hypothetical protein [Sedimentisphaerales bacterium]HNU30897.1 hypothetical protein [Sedimentisphaerales bacterium]
MNAKTKSTVLTAIAVSSLLPAILVYGGEPPAATGRVFPLEEISIFNYGGAAKGQLQSGTVAPDCGDIPTPGVTYPTFKSGKPIYGTVTFDMSLFDPQAGVQYCFALDESGGAGYDRLLFDVNHDSDLTDDPVVGPAKSPAGDMQEMPRSVLFENVQIHFDYGPGQGVFTQVVMPRLMRVGEDASYMFFTAPTARKGKIQLGSREVELVLAQVQTIAGRYDRPMTGAFLSGVEESLPLLGYWRCVNGTFYSLSATPCGDKVTVTPYSGPFGVLETGAGGRNIAAPTIDFGWMSSRDAFIDLGDCPQKDGKLNLPVGDYRPFRLAVRYGQRRIGIATDTSRLGHKDAPAVFPIAIRQDKPCVLDFLGKLEVVFKSPATGSRFKAGDTLEVQAMLCDAAAGTMISALEDTTKKTGSTELPNGRSLDLFESVSPAIRITNSLGQTVAEGPMPFG